MAGIRSISQQRSWKKRKKSVFCFQEHSDQYFLAHHRALPVVFGLPLVVPADLDGRAWSGRGLYQSVWSQVARLVSPQAKQQQGSPVNHAMDW